MPIITILDSCRQIPDHLWVSQTSPFMSKAFWLALEETQAVGTRAGWVAQHIALSIDNEMQAVLPVFVKNHHRGEYVFDQGWAQSYARYGLDYYPRLVSSVPFTPVTGQRVWLAAGIVLADVMPLLLAAVHDLATQLKASSWHGLFIDQTLLEYSLKQPSDRLPLVQRTGCQFLWQDNNYVDFQGFINTLTAKRRKAILVERAKVTAQSIDCRVVEGAALSDADLQFFYACYQRTYHVRGQQAYLSIDFFKQLQRDMPDSLVLIIATHKTDDGVSLDIAAALFFKDNSTLYGRYWGALQDVDSLHFEVCYYQGIHYALTNGLQYFDPGTQGEHKLLRGFAPVLTHSVHWLAQPDFMLAVADFVRAEHDEVLAYVADAMTRLPFKQ